MHCIAAFLRKWNFFCPGGANGCAARRRGENFFVFLIRTKPEISRARAGNQENLRNREKPGAEMRCIDITQKETGKGRKREQIARTKDRGKAGE